MFLVAYQMVSDGAIWVVKQVSSLSEAEAHINNYNLETASFLVYEYSKDFDFENRLNPSCLVGLAPVIAFSSENEDAKAGTNSTGTIESTNSSSTRDCFNFPENIYNVHSGTMCKGIFFCQLATFLCACVIAWLRDMQAWGR